MLKITTLGTSHGDPVYNRFNTSTLLEVDGCAYLIDAGAPVNALLVRLNFNFSRLNAVCITHMHEDHVGGLSGIVKTLVKYPVDGQHTVIMFPEREAVVAFSNWMAAQHREVPETLVTYRVAFAAMPIHIGGETITPIRTEHFYNEGKDSKSFSYKISTSQGNVLFTGDLRNDFEDFPLAAAQDCRGCVCELTHYPLEKAIPVLRQCRFDKLIFTHIANRWNTEAGKAKFATLIDALPYECVIADDFDQFELNCQGS